VLPVVERAGPATVVSYTVLHDRAGEPEAAVAILEFADGARTVARTEAAPPDLADLESHELVGARATVTPADGPARFDLA
jgi:acetyl-CoA C-acetyltransferase